MAEIGKAYINVVPYSPGIQGKIQTLLNSGNAGEKSGSKLGSGLLKGLKTTLVAGAAVATAAGSILAGAISAGADLQQSFGGLDTLYGDAAAGAKQYAMAAAEAGISANSYAEQAVSMGAALKSAYGGDTAAAMEAANTAILDMADNSAKLGTPLESIQAAYQGFAKGQYQLLDNLKLGYGGTKEEMQRLLADAEAFSGVKYDINNLGDVYDAIHVIQGELGLTGVAADEAKTTFSGSLNALKASWTNTMAALSTGEGLEESLANLSTSVGNFSNNILNMLGKVAPQVPSFLLGITDALIANAPALIAGGAEMIAQLVVGLVNSIPQIIEQIPEIFRKTKEAFAKIDWASLGKAIIDGLISGLTTATGMLWETIKTLAADIFKNLKDGLAVNSPSKKAIPIGRGLPEGLAVGVTDGTSFLDNRIERLASHSLTTMRRAMSVPMERPALAGVQSGHAGNEQVNVNVVLQGDADKLFRVVKTYNDKRTRATGYNSLSRR